MYDAETGEAIESCPHSKQKVKIEKCPVVFSQAGYRVFLFGGYYVFI